jgi:hypothetical protein
VLGERRHLRGEVAGDVVRVVGLVAPAEPDVVDVLHAEALAEVLAVEVRVAAAGERGVEGDPPGVTVVRVVVIPVLEEHRRRVARDHGLGVHLADPTHDGLADLGGVL